MKNILFLFTFVFSSIIYGQKKNLEASLLAVKGYDVVSYFTQKSPIRGLEKFVVEWEGARYLFASEKNKKSFLKNPSMYLPAYGGWCAYAMVKGKEVDINPTAFYIQQGQLHLFYKTKWVDTQAKWVKNAAQYKLKADTAWAIKVEKANED